MGRLPTGNRKYQIQEMWDVHHEIVRLLLMGMKHVDIATILGISPVTVSYTANSPIAKRQLSIMRGARDASAVDCAAEIKALCPKAVKVLEESMESELEVNRIKASLAILDRGGHAPVQRIQAQHAHMHFTPEELDDIKKRAKDVIDVQYIECKEASDDNGV
jgi:predicted transcriptional regulator